MINFLVLWLDRCFNIPKNEPRCYIGINEMHKNREDKVREYWAKTTGVSPSQFRKTSFKRSKTKKIYPNHNDHYGVLNVAVKNPARVWYNILGLIYGLTRLGSSTG